MVERPMIGIIGEGNVGSHLAEGFKGAGYQVDTAGHNKEDVQRVAEKCDLLVLAVPPTELENAVEECGGAHKNKILIDVSNVTDEKGNYAGSLRESRAETLQKRYRDAKVIKAFNTVFADNMDDAQVEGRRLSVFVAGDDEDARRRVREIGEQMGFDAVDAGALENARFLEALGYLNMTLGMKMGMGTDIGFRLVHPSA